MGYFSNGSEGDWYEAEYCSRCVHGQNDHCPIMDLHMMWNYEACNPKTPEDTVKHNTLESFIPRSSDGIGNDQCKMFVVLL